MLLLVVSTIAAGAQSKWVHPGADGRLVYAKTAQGDRIPDFSWCGYRGGGVALPKVSTKQMVSPDGAGTIRR